MRKQARPAAPEVFQAHAAAWNAQWKTLRERNPGATFSWYEKDKVSAREMILPTLRAMNQAHCSFCDGFPVENTTTEPIEHFRPKSDPRFYLLAYEWTNLYYCCNRCQKKGSLWSDDPEPLAPDAVDYRCVDYFCFDGTTGGISPNPKANNEAQARAKITIKLYDLDSPIHRRYRMSEARKHQKTREPELGDHAYRDFIEWCHP